MDVKLKICGKEQAVPAGTSITDLLRARKVKPEAVVAELNGRIVPREEYPRTFPAAGDELELIAFMGGG